MYREDAHENRSLFLCGFSTKLTAYDRATGKVAWVFNDQQTSSYYVDFAIVGGHVYVAVGRSLVCLAYATGTPVGMIPLPHDVERVMADGTQLFAVGGGGISCVDPAGRVVWSAPHDLSTCSRMPTMGFPGNLVHGFRDNG